MRDYDEREKRRRDSTYWLSSPPAMTEFLSASQGEGGVKHRVMHGVANDTMGLWVETLRKDKNVLFYILFFYSTNWQLLYSYFELNVHISMLYLLMSPQYFSSMEPWWSLMRFRHILRWLHIIQTVNMSCQVAKTGTSDVLTATILYQPLGKK